MSANPNPRGPESLETPSALLATDPPARVARWTAWLLLAVSAAAAGFVTLVQLPEVVSASFVLEAADGTDPIQAPLAGEVDAVRVSEGQPVQAGQELFTLRSDEIRNWQEQFSRSREDQRALADRGTTLEETHKAELAITDAEIEQADREVKFREKYLTTSRDFLRRERELAEGGFVSQVDLLRYELDTAGAEKDLVVGEKAKQQLTLERQKLTTARVRQRTDERAEGQRLVLRITTLESELANCTGAVKSVRAPYDAVVLSLRQRNAGSVVAAGAELCQLARTASPPVARLSLPESSLHRLRSGQPLRLRYDAFPYQRYGSVPATLEWLSPAAVPGPNGATFQAKCRFLPARADSWIQPKVGMRGEARIVVGRRTVLQQILEPLHRLRERVAEG